MKTKKFQDFRHSNGVYMASSCEERSEFLPPAMYNLQQDRNGNIFYCDISMNHDSIIDIPSKEFQSIVGELEHFLKPSTEKLFSDFGFIYKRSSLLYGEPGTGKTVIVNRVAREVIKSGGIVIFNPNPSYLSKVFEQLDDIQPNQKTMIIFEELDKLLESYEGQLLSLLDGEIQKRNIIYMATTNYIDRIPPRILRPGRFSSVVEIPFPNMESRRFYLNQKLKDNRDLVEEIVHKTENFSIDELKEVVLAVFCLGQSIDVVTGRIHKNKDLCSGRDPEYRDSDDDDWDEDYSKKQPNAADLSSVLKK